MRVLIRRDNREREARQGNRDQQGLLVHRDQGAILAPRAKTVPVEMMAKQDNLEVQDRPGKEARLVFPGYQVPKGIKAFKESMGQKENKVQLEKKVRKATLVL